MMLDNAVPASLSGKAFVQAVMGRTIDDGPRIHVWFFGSSISFYINMAKDPRVFAEALEPPHPDHIQSWACAPGWFVEKISGNKIRVGLGGMVITLSPAECKRLAQNIRQVL